MPLPQPILSIVGRGPVAQAFALFAQRAGFPAERLRLDLDDTPIPPALAARQLAISLGSWQLLARICRPPPAAPIETVDVSVPGHPGRTRITATDMGIPALGYVLRYSALVASLRQAVRAAGLGAATPPADAPEIIVHAEGDTGDDTEALEFDQAALLAEVGVEAGNATTAWECFTSEGPLALLPLPEAHRYSLVWCASPAESRRRAALTPQALAAELQRAFGWRLGRLSIESPRVVAPLHRRRRRQTVGGHEVWIGNAAQTLHPVAGQGLNLGLRDAFELARDLGEACAASLPPDVALRRYAEQRRRDRYRTMALTDGLARVFTIPPLRPLQSVALAALDIARPARAALARQLMFGHR